MSVLGQKQAPCGARFVEDVDDVRRHHRKEYPNQNLVGQIAEEALRQAGNYCNHHYRQQGFKRPFALIKRKP
jgi:hypothetical protein